MHVSIFVAAMALAVPAAAQPAESAADEIIVKGHKSQKERVQTYVKTLTPGRLDDQIGRFMEPICPAMVGLAPHENEAVAKRIKQVAKASGVAVAEGRCEANLLVIATTDKRVFINSIPRYAPSLLTGLSEQRIRALAGAPGPVASWQVGKLLDQDGNSLAQSPIDPDNPAATTTVAASNDAGRITKMTQASFHVSVLVVERQALARISTRQLADYAAMRTLAPVDPLSHRHALAGNPHGALPAASILTLFDANMPRDAAPPSVTWWDYAFLQALYDSTGTRTATLQRSEIQTRMNKILASVPDDER